MTKSMIAASVALVAGVAIAAPTSVWSADPPQQPPAASAQPGTADSSGMAGMPGMGGTGRMGGLGGMMGGMPDQAGMHERMMRRMAQMTPRQRCEERLARR